MELGDYAQVEERDCDCLMGALGLRIHLSEVRSFEKLTGEGVTFARSNLEQILDEVLPARFGGAGPDYQVAEEEAANGATRLVLRISPSVGALDPDAVRAALLDELGRDGASSRYHAGIWRSARTIEVRREPPLATRAGKVLPFHLLRRTEVHGGGGEAMTARGRPGPRRRGRESARSEGIGLCTKWNICSILWVDDAGGCL